MGKEVLKTNFFARLEYHEDAGKRGSHKFYEVYIRPDHSVYALYGRIGSEPRLAEKRGELEGLGGAIQLVNSKLAKGYKHVDALTLPLRKAVNEAIQVASINEQDEHSEEYLKELRKSVRKALKE